MFDIDYDGVVFVFVVVGVDFVVVFVFNFYWVRGKKGEKFIFCVFDGLSLNWYVLSWFDFSGKKGFGGWFVLLIIFELCGGVGV